MSSMDGEDSPLQSLQRGPKGRILQVEAHYHPQSRQYVVLWGDILEAIPDATKVVHGTVVVTRARDADLRYIEPRCIKYQPGKVLVVVVEDAFPALRGTGGEGETEADASSLRTDSDKEMDDQDEEDDGQRRYRKSSQELEDGLTEQDEESEGTTIIKIPSPDNTAIPIANPFSSPPQSAANAQAATLGIIFPPQQTPSDRIVSVLKSIHSAVRTMTSGTRPDSESSGSSSNGGLQTPPTLSSSTSATASLVSPTQPSSPPPSFASLPSLDDSDKQFGKDVATRTNQPQQQQRQQQQQQQSQNTEVHQKPLWPSAWLETEQEQLRKAKQARLAPALRQFGKDVATPLFETEQEQLRKAKQARLATELKQFGKDVATRTNQPQQQSQNTEAHQDPLLPFVDSLVRTSQLEMMQLRKASLAADLKQFGKELTKMINTPVPEDIKEIFGKKNDVTILS
ncbi:MAG: hypothetical protein J3R72DRAFT_419503 [Linnemannia gamsii]|nr:MAG: hypothetical protein J3R72DRAFT_419503 [Linnemannia gamsii]